MSASGGAELEVVKHPHACHKRFRTKEEAEVFIAQWAKAYGGRRAQVNSLADSMSRLEL